MKGKFTKHMKVFMAFYQKSSRDTCSGHCMIKKALAGKLAKYSTLCTDIHRSYTALAKAEGTHHQNIHARNKQCVKDKIYHDQNANQTARSLKDWIAGFNGVATKYLQNYLSRFMVPEYVKGKTDKVK